jgi:hypothetical protein
MTTLKKENERAPMVVILLWKQIVESTSGEKKKADRKTNYEEQSSKPKAKAERPETGSLGSVIDYGKL